MPSLEPNASAAAAPIVVEAVTDAAALPALAAAWDALLPETIPGAVFRSPSWLLPWWNTFSSSESTARDGSQRMELRVLVAWRAGRLVGVLPCYRHASRLGSLVGLRTLRLLGDNVVGSDYLGPIAAPRDADAVADAFAARILDEEDDVAFGGLLAGEPLLEAMTRAAGEAEVERAPLLPCPYLDIRSTGRDFDAWLRTLPRGAGPQLLRRRRWLERQPGYRVEIVEDEARTAEAMEDLFRVHEQRWAEDGGSEGIAGERVKRFHREAAATLARRGWARTYLVHADGAVRSALYGFERGGRFAFYQSGNDPAWRKRSVGTVALGAAIEDSFRRGLAEFDFLRGGEAYKTTFASGRRELLRLRVSTGMRARARHLAERLGVGARAATRSVLPAQVVEWVRRRGRAQLARQS